MKKSIIILFIPFAIFSIANLIFNQGFENVLSLNPHLILTQSEIWRIFTYPLLDTSLISLLICGFSLVLFYPQLRKYFTRLHLGFLVLLLLLIQGAMQLLIFWGKDINFLGYSSVASFFLVLTAVVAPRGKLAHRPFSSLSNINAVLIFFMLFFASGLERMWDADTSAAIAYFFPILCGIGFAFAVSIQLYIFRKYFLPKRQAKSFAEIAELLSQARESMRRLETSLVDEPSGMQMSSARKSSYWAELSDDPAENENNLNSILDKINENGLNSLTESEINFLKNLSDKL